MSLKMEEESGQSPILSLTNDCGSHSKGARESNESVFDEVESPGMPDDDLEGFLNAENLSDQTPGGLFLYDCSFSTSFEKSLTPVNQTLNDASESNMTRHIHDLSCSLAVIDDDQQKSLDSDNTDVDKTFDRIGTEVQKKNSIIKELCTLLGEANRQQLYKSKEVKQLVDRVSWVRESVSELSNLSVCSLEGKKEDYTTDNGSGSFRLSSYMKDAAPLSFGSQLQSLENEEFTGQGIKRKERSIQTSPVPINFLMRDSEVVFNKKQIVEICHSFLSTTKSLKSEMLHVRQLIKQPYENDEDFPFKKIVLYLKEIGKNHESEISSLKDQLTSEMKHHHTVQNALKDENKTLKMRFQDKIKQRDNEIAELKARIVDTGDKCDGSESVGSPRVDSVETPNRPQLDDSFNSSMSEEETFTNLLSRTKMEYLKLTPSEYVEDEVIDTVHIPDAYRQLLEDYKLKLLDMEKKFDANKRYLEEQTHDREVERDEFQQALESMQQQIEELKKENAKLYEVNKQNDFQIEEYAARLKCAEEDEMEMVQKHETTEKELKAAVEKIFELRDIIRDLENQIDSMANDAIQLKEQNQVLADELEKQEMTNKKEQPTYNEQDTFGVIALDVTDEIQSQLQELARKIEGKINEMDNFQSQTRPNSSCSGVVSAVSTEDISCRELAGRSSRNFEHFPVEDFGSVILNEIRRLESQFESLVRFEDVVMKRMKDAELRYSGQKANIEELENQISVYQEKCSHQALKIADLEGRVDAMRFETSNQSLISSRQSRLQATLKHLEDYKSMYFKREQDISQMKKEVQSLQTKRFEKSVEDKEVQVSVVRNSGDQTFESNSTFSDSYFEGVSPEKIRRMETVNQFSTSILSVPRNMLTSAQTMLMEPEPPENENFDEENTKLLPEMSRVAMKAAVSGGGDADRFNESAPNIREMDNNLQELHRLLMEKDKIIRALERQIRSTDHQNLQKKGSRNRVSLDGNKSKKDEKCEQEDVIVDVTLNPDQPKHGQPKENNAGHIGCSGQKNDTYEVAYASEYTVEGDLLKYIGTKLLHEGPRRGSSEYGQGRVAETDRQIEIATLNTQIQQLRRALEDEQKKSENLRKQLKSCEETKAELRSRSPANQSPVQKVTSSISVHQMQQRELVHQIEEGRNLLNTKHKEIRILQDRVQELESNLKSKLEHERELKTRLNSSSALLKKCEEHGRELSTSNQDHMKEIRRLRNLLDKVNVRNNNEIVQVSTNAYGNDHLENFLRAKSYRKALAWQKKYLSSVIVGYKSILRQVGHGTEHPALIQTQIPLAPCAVGLFEGHKGKIRFRIIVFAVLALVRMRYMVNRWLKKRSGDGSPESEYKASRHPIKLDVNSVIRPTKGILLHNNRVNFMAPRASDINDARGDNVDAISEYISRFESIENEISSSLSRKFPS